MSKKVVYLLLAVSFGLNLGMVATTVVHRRGPDGPPPGPPEGRGPGPRPDPQQLVEDHLQRITRHLDLDAGQQREIRAVLERHAAQLAAYQAAVGESGRRLSDVFGAPEFDPVLFERLTADAAGARTRLDSLSAVMLVDEASVLTPKQRRKFAEVASSVYSRPQGGRREGGPPPGR